MDQLYCIDQLILLHQNKYLKKTRPVIILSDIISI